MSNILSQSSNTEKELKMVKIDHQDVKSELANLIDGSNQSIGASTSYDERID